MTTPAQFHPDLHALARWLPRGLSPRLLRVLRLVTRLAPNVRLPPGVNVHDERVPGHAGAPDVRVRVYMPSARSGRGPALLWIHGGGYVIGKPEQDDLLCAKYAVDLGLLVTSVDYRLAPEHPFPAPLDDCYAALKWLSQRADVAPDRIAIAGASAGGGLAAALAQRACDVGEIRPAFQALLYPMLDDRTATRTDLDGANHRLWNDRSNLFGWTSYLGQAPGKTDVPAHAVPGRRIDLRGLPPAWIGVGTFDLFHDEDVSYANRLREAGVPCELLVVPGAFHGFDAVARTASVARTFTTNHLDAVRRALFPERLAA
ncbi:MAG TPA: alpha/beta hydrolase [Gemmatimonadaceae bacterium]|nr:alpha/beta hydrolase [Gemmatimonadaceae bacterium]